jgi:preprotein translocase subunit SecF
VELFRGVNVDWLGKKWYFLGFSLIFSVAGLISMGVHWARIGSPVPLGVDFRGGTQVQVQFAQTPELNQIRQAMDASGIRDSSIQPIRNVDQPASNDVLISLPEQTNEAALDAGRQQIEDALRAHYNNPFTVRNVQVVGPTVGKQLEKQAGLATLYSMAGMLIYLWFRFQLIYGVAAVVACFHDEPGNQPDGDRGNSDADWLLDERHHRRVRSHSGKPAPEPARISPRRGEPQH